MNQPELFDSGFSVGPGRRNFAPQQQPTAGRKGRILFRCSAPKCKFCKAVNVPMQEQRATWGTVQQLDPAAVTAARNATRCREHPNAFLTFAQVEATISTAHRCDARCLNAIGPICVCSCGGANHGASYL